MRLSLIIPCYNEAENLASLFNACAKHFMATEHEVIFVNNGSTDHSASVFEELLPQHPYARCVTVPVNQGYGYGILAGLSAAKGDYLGWTHADLQADPGDALTAFSYINENTAAFVKGKRYGRHFGDIIFTVGMSIFDSLIMRRFLWDINAQPNIFPKNFFSSWVNPPHDFSLDLYAYVMAQEQQLPVIRFPVYFGKRTAGEAHLNSIRAKLRYTWRTIKYSFALKNRLVR
jgi:glycosyltransferase involved in cell wall biosynthesis